MRLSGNAEVRYELPVCPSSGGRFFRVFVMVSDFAAVYKLTIKVNANDDLMMVAA
uniref:hypothetical protein n=1 Tax=Escherichia coli TaxID=562 RepID=UPI000AFF8D0A|nr:hypothetical protein [Escherichia coli]